RSGEFADLIGRHPVEEHRHRERRHLLVGHVAARVGVDEPADLGGGQLAAVALAVDEVDGVEGFDGHEEYASSVRGPKASGMTSSIVRMPDTVSSSIPSAECSNSS